MADAWLIPLRNKERHVARALRSIFEQTRKIDIIVCDQGSTDRSRDVVLSLMNHHYGPEKIRLIHCPLGGEYGMEGLNRNLMYGIERTPEYERYLILSADDTVEPNCAELMLNAFDEHSADAVGGLFVFVDPEGKVAPMRSDFPTENRFVTSMEHLERRVGGSSFRGLTREFALWRPLEGDAICDVWWTYWACCRNGYYCIADAHTGTYWKHADSGNAGLEGRRRAAKTDVELGQVNLDLWLEIMRTWGRIMRVGATAEGAGWAWKPDDKQTAIAALLNLGMGYANCWDDVRRMIQAGEKEKGNVNVQAS